MRKQREKEDFWDEHEDFRSESCSDESDFVVSSFDGYISVEENLYEEENGGGNSVAWQDANCGDCNKDDRIAATLLIPRQHAKPNQTVKSRRQTALIRLCDIYKRLLTNLSYTLAWPNRLSWLGLEPE